MERTTNKQSIMIANDGDKVVCVGNVGYNSITIGKIYEVLDAITQGEVTYLLLLCNDDRINEYYLAIDFIPLNDWREQQINKVI